MLRQPLGSSQSAGTITRLSGLLRFHNGETRMKILSKAIVLAGFAALAACGDGNDAADNIEAAADNQADALEMQAENLEERADEAADNAADSLENQARALENQADATREAGENQAEAVEDNR